MLNVSGQVKILLCLGPADMRRSFDGLAAMVEEVLDDNPLSGHLFVFRNRRGDRLKILYFDRDGLAIWYRRLEQGTFQMPAIADDKRSAEIRSDELTMLLRGIDYTISRPPKLEKSNSSNLPAPTPLHP